MKWNQFQFVFELEDIWAVVCLQDAGSTVRWLWSMVRQAWETSSDPFWLDVNVLSIGECIFSDRLVALNRLVYKS